MVAGLRKLREGQFFGCVKAGLAAIGAQLCHDAFNDWVGDALRQLEGTTFGHDFYSLTAGIAQHLARAALAPAPASSLSKILLRNGFMRLFSRVCNHCSHFVSRESGCGS
jgi:hypothetical protein